eukprot:GHVR01073531.1.p1 GENE.GHVR01073531.1~~GHVR01073531.1.p1  ORF type:complete len:503 (+),score=174.39 GHVR01073531.1:219-1511(+)
MEAVNAYNQLYDRERDVLCRGVGEGGGASLTHMWSSAVLETSLYTCLNKMEGDVVLRATCWFPSVEETTIRDTIAYVANSHQVSAFLVTHTHTHDASGNSTDPPTYITRTSFTDPFQELVDTYGVPRYGEVNPGVITCISFPFLFGVMYGDIGHGSILLCVSIFLLTHHLQLQNTFMKPLADARWMFFFMGLFAVYSGFLYNDFMAAGFNIFGSQWKREGNHGVLVGESPYTFGIDPAWKGAQNSLLFTNSLKMKISVIVGVVHMTIGILCKGINSILRRNRTDFLFEFLPQLLFMLCIFGYMDYLIVIKWLTPTDNSVFPSVVTTVIDMTMATPFDKSMAMFDGQEYLQYWLLLVSAVCMPMMLIPKPLILLLQHKWKKRHTHTHTHSQCYTYLDQETGNIHTHTHTHNARGRDVIPLEHTHTHTHTHT